MLAAMDGEATPIPTPESTRAISTSAIPLVDAVNTYATIDATTAHVPKTAVWRSPTFTAT
jgi:hypothetical protein